MGCFRRYLLLVCLLPAQAMFSSSSADETPSPEELLRAFHESASAGRIFPYKLSAKLALTPDKDVNIPGQITYSRDKDRSRIEITAGDYHETRVLAGDQLYVSATQALALPRRATLENLEKSWMEISARSSCCLAFSKVEKKKIQGAEAYCFTVASQTTRPRRFCLERESKALLESYDGFERVSFLDYRTLEGFRYPTRIQVIDDGKMFLEIQGLEIQKGEAPAESFTAPADSRVFEKCADQENEHPLQTPMPHVPSRWHSSYASVYGVVQTDGSFTDVRVQVSRADQSFAQAMKEAATHWRFSPARCGGKAVVSETQLEIHN
jgi:hypothetical protein